MSALDEFQVNVGSGTLDDVSEQSKKKLVLTPTTETALKTLQQDMRGNLTIGKVTEIAIELLLKARGKEIRLVDRETGRIAEAYYLWK